MKLVAAWTTGLFGFWAPAPVPADAVDGPALTADPVLLWSARLEGAAPDSASRSEPGGPVVAGNYVLVGYSGANELQVFDRRDGRKVGAFPAKGPVASAGVVGTDRVWFADAAGYTWCYLLDQVGGTAAWSHYSGAPIVSSPVVVDGTLYVANVDEQVYALDAATGELRWRYEHPLDVARSASLELFGAPPPVIDGDTVYAGFSDGFLVAISRAAGEERWNASVGEGTYPDLIAPARPVGDGVVAAGFDRPVESLDPTTRSVRWRVEHGTAAAITLDAETLYVGGSDGVLRAIGAKTGEVVWEWDSLTGGTLTSPVVTPRGLLVASGEAGLYLVDPASGAVRWRFDPGTLLTGFASSPAVSGDAVYALSNAGVLYALRGRATPLFTGRDRPDWRSPRSAR